MTDSAGRRVEIPDRVSRVYTAGAPASVLVYALAPDNLLGWNRERTPSERALLPARFAELPALGPLTGRGNTANVEVIIAARPDVIVDVGTVGPTFVSLADSGRDPRADARGRPARAAERAIARPAPGLIKFMPAMA